VAGKLVLPIRANRESSPVAFQPAETSEPWQCEELRASSSTRDTLHDKHTSENVTVIENDFGEFKDKHHGLINGSKVSERWSIIADDPLSAKGGIQWQQTGGRDDWHWNTEVSVNIDCDSEFFYITADLIAYNNGESVFEKKYEDKIERKFI